MNRPTFEQFVRSGLVVFDGAMGTRVHNYVLEIERDWRGHENCTEILTQSRPDVIGEIHESYLAAGSDCIETNTFGANRIVLGEFGLSDLTVELNRASAELARACCLKFEREGKPKYVVGSIGPGTKLISLGNVTWDVMLRSYQEQCRGLLEGGADAFLIETSQDLLQIKCAINAAEAAMKEAGREVPIIVQASMDTQNRMLLGSDTAALATAIEPYQRVIALGLNCASGPVEMGEHVQYLSHHWPRLISVQPNAGLPIQVDGQAHFPLGPADFARAMTRFVREFGVSIVGGCCGTTPEHIAAMVHAVRENQAREEIRDDAEAEGAGGSAPCLLGSLPSDPQRKVDWSPAVSCLSGAEDIRQDNSYLIIAERTNTNGSKRFRTLLQAEDWDGLVSVAREEVRDGSQVLDVCVDFVGRDGVGDMRQVVSRYARQIPAPLMIDSTSPEVMEAALELAGGRCILNSMNLEDGEERVAQICSLARKYGAAVVAGCIDEDKENAMARTADRKLAIARRIRDLAVNTYGLRDHDLLFDPLVLPISTGVEADRRNALETIEGTRRIARELPGCHTVVGLSNVSFGLKPAARVVLNSAFLHELREAGLTAAIVHASKLLPQNRIPPEQWAAAMDLIHDRRGQGDPLTRFVSLFNEEAAHAPVASETLSIEERLKRHIIDGEKRDLAAHLDEAMKGHPPLEIINDILLAGMKTVGELFGSGQMQLPFVLQSAETMKAAVAHLQPHMEKVQSAGKGTIVLATVKGDVHDIGKNLVDIILSNNGYSVVNLGIKQPINEILRAVAEHKADAIGMSGLLVKSVAVMKENLQEMNAQGITLPVLLGGAALTRDYAEEELADLYGGGLIYCKDAFAGLHAMDALADGKLPSLRQEQRERQQRRRVLRERAVKPSNTEAAPVTLARDNPVPTPPFWGRRVVRDIPPAALFPYINTNALFRGQWGLKKGKLSDREYERLLNETAEPKFRELQRRAADDGFLRPAVVYGYFPAQSRGDELIVYDPAAIRNPRSEARDLAPWLTFRFPRQEGRRRLCIADFFRSVDSGQMDVLGVQLVTMGPRVGELAEELRAASQYQDYLYLHGFGVESAEALAELWHKRMRQELGFGSEDSPDTGGIFQQKYRGSRYSFGYPACPNIEDRRQIAAMLKPEDLGVSLTESFMLIPEQSTDAIVVHHPQAKYFDV